MSPRQTCAMLVAALAACLGMHADSLDAQVMGALVDQLATTPETSGSCPTSPNSSRFRALIS